MNKAFIMGVFIRQFIRIFFIGLIFTFLQGNSFSQDINTLIKLNRACIQLGSTALTQDSLQADNNLAGINSKMAAHQVLLLKSAEYFISSDYEQSDYYIKQVRMNFRNKEYNNLKFLLMICNFAHTGDMKETARHYYIIKKINLMEPGSMKIIHKEIAGSLERVPFDEALSHYFYYHQRLNILDEIYNAK